MGFVQEMYIKPTSKLYLRKDPHTSEKWTDGSIYLDLFECPWKYLSCSFWVSMGGHYYCIVEIRKPHSLFTLILFHSISTTMITEIHVIFLWLYTQTENLWPFHKLLLYYMNWIINSKICCHFPMFCSYHERKMEILFSYY